MAATEVPGLADIQAWAQFLGIDITDAMTKAQQLMQTDPAAVRTGGEHLTTVASGLDAGHQDLRRAGAEVLAGWSGEAAKAFDPHQAGLVNHVADTMDATTQLASHLDGVASAFEQSQNTVVTATGAAATALRMLKV
jgi:uncharacterized protein YukE